MGVADAGGVRSLGVGQDGTAHKRNKRCRDGAGRMTLQDTTKLNSEPQDGAGIVNRMISDVDQEGKEGEAALATLP